jgi:TRAP-type mannitol/chloroaromatic compound transport system permease small subunit
MDKLSAMVKAIDNLSEWTGKIVSFFVYAIAALMITEIVVRNLFDISLVWVPDYTMFLFSFLILSGGYTLLHGRMIRMDILHSRWSSRTQAIVDLLIYAPLFFLFCGLMLWKGGDLALKSIVVREADRFSYAPPLYITKTLVPLAALLILIQGIALFVRTLKIALSGDKKAE